MATITLASGHEMPLVGFGLWQIPNEQAADTVYHAIKIGYRLFDGGYDYKNEAGAGQGIQRAIDEGIVKRKDIFITTKLWNNYHKREHAIEMAKSQNETWGLGYIDLYLIHYPIPLKYVDPQVIKYPAWWVDTERTKIELAKVSMHETWRALEELVEAGITKSIGISNASAQTLYDIQTYAKHPISNLQIEHHPYLVQPELITAAQENGISVTAYTSMGPKSFLWNQLPEAYHVRPKAATPLFDNEVIKRIARRAARSTAQVLLRWAVQRGIAVIPKSIDNVRAKQNFEILDFNLTKEEIEEINALDQGLRFNDPGFWLDKPLRIFA